MATSGLNMMRARAYRHRCQFKWFNILLLLQFVYICCSWARSSKITSSSRWHKDDIVSYMDTHPNRAYFADLFRKGGFRSGMEVGVADGRFSEHFLKLNSNIPLLWIMIEPFPNPRVKQRFHIDALGTANFSNGSWARSGMIQNMHLIFLQELSTDKRLLRDIADNSLDFVYLDGAHNYKNVFRELPAFYKKIRPGGVLAGHDYCDHGEPSRSCLGCERVPRCAKYTDYGIAHGKPDTISQSQSPVVRAVHDWLSSKEPLLTLYFTVEDFTRESLKNDGMDYDLVITNTRNPSWFVIKPED